MTNGETIDHETEAGNLVSGRDVKWESTQGHHLAEALTTEATASFIIRSNIIHILDIESIIQLIVIPNPSVIRC